MEEDVLTAVDLLTHRPGMSYEDYVKNIVLSRNETAIQVILNDLHHNLHRAELALATLDTSTRERQALLDETWPSPPYPPVLRDNPDSGGRSNGPAAFLMIEVIDSSSSCQCKDVNKWRMDMKGV